MRGTSSRYSANRASICAATSGLAIVETCALIRSVTAASGARRSGRARPTVSCARSAIAARLSRDDGVEAAHAADQRIRQLRRSGVRPLLCHRQLGQEHRLSVRRRALQPLARRSAEPRGPVSAQLERRFVRELLRRREIAQRRAAAALSLPGDDGLVIAPAADGGQSCHGAQGRAEAPSTSPPTPAPARRNRRPT